MSNAPDLDARPSPSPARRPSPALLASALTGLLGMAVTVAACADDGVSNPTVPPANAPPAAANADPAPDEPSKTAAPGAAAPGAPTPTAPVLNTLTVNTTDGGTYNFTVSTTPVTFEEFTAACTARGGFVQTTATCAGNNACKGISYLDGYLTEHSCKAMNGCGPGMSCVELPKDLGKTGKQIYEEGACASTCHAQFTPSFDSSVFQLYVRPGTDPDFALDRFKNGSQLRLWSLTAFGSHGVNDDGTAYANMPAYYTQYSRAEIQRVTDYVKTLTIKPKVYEILGPKPK